MAKSFTDVVQDSPRMGIGIPAKAKKPLSRAIFLLAGPTFRFKLLERLVRVLSCERVFRRTFARDPFLRLRIRLANPGDAPDIKA